MSDYGLRVLERRWQETRDHDDLGRWLGARVRLGEISYERLEQTLRFMEDCRLGDELAGKLGLQPPSIRNLESGRTTRLLIGALVVLLHRRRPVKFYGEDRAHTDRLASRCRGMLSKLRRSWLGSGVAVCGHGQQLARQWLLVHHTWKESDRRWRESLILHGYATVRAPYLSTRVHQAGEILWQDPWEAILEVAS